VEEESVFLNIIFLISLLKLFSGSSRYNSIHFFCERIYGKSILLQDLFIATSMWHQMYYLSEKYRPAYYSSQSYQWDIVVINEEITPQNFVAEEFVHYWCIKILPKTFFFFVIIAHY
jgi:hypothetical protein